MTKIPWRPSSLLWVEGTKERNPWKVVKIGPFKSFEIEAHTSDKTVTEFYVCPALLKFCLGPIFLHRVSIFLFWNVNDNLCIVYWQDVTSFHILQDVTVKTQKLLSFRRSHLFIVALIVCATVVFHRKWSPVPMYYRLLPTFSSIRFSVFRLILKSLICLDLSFVNGDKHGSLFILPQAVIQLCHHHLLKMHSFFHCIILASLSKIRCS